MATATKDRPAKSKDDAGAKARAKQREAEEKAAAKEKAKAAKDKQKAKAERQKEKEREARAKDKQKAEREKEKAREARVKGGRGGGAGTGPRKRSGTSRPRSGSPQPEVHEKGWIAEELGKAGDVQRSTKRPTLAASFTTRDHDVIRRWAESRGGVPADVRGTGDGSPGGAGVLRIEFRDEADRLEEVDWTAFFETFEASDVDFLYQEFTKDGGESRFHKIVRAQD